MDGTLGEAPVGERRRKAIENLVGGLFGFAVGVGLIGLALMILQAIGSDGTPLLIVLVTVGTGFGYACVRGGMSVARMISLHVRARRLGRASRWEEFVPLGRELVEEAEWYNGFDDRVTIRRREGLTTILLRLERFEEAGQLAEQNLQSLSRKSGATHPDTVKARELAEALRQAARDPAAAEMLRQALRNANDS